MPFEDLDKLVKGNKIDIPIELGDYSFEEDKVTGLHVYFLPDGDGDGDDDDDDDRDDNADEAENMHWLYLLQQHAKFLNQTGCYCVSKFLDGSLV